jgi:hypothetical protein
MDVAGRGTGLAGHRLQFIGGVEQRLYELRPDDGRALPQAP